MQNEVSNMGLQTESKELLLSAGYLYLVEEQKTFCLALRHSFGNHFNGQCLLVKRWALNGLILQD